MPTNTKVSSPYRDKYREALFRDAYSIKPEIETTNFIQDNGLYDKVILKFELKDNTFGLIEHFDNNLTDYVVLEHQGKQVETYDTFFEAELDMVEMMRNL